MCFGGTNDGCDECIERSRDMDYADCESNDIDDDIDDDFIEPDTIDWKKTGEKS